MRCVSSVTVVVILFAIGCGADAVTEEQLAAAGIVHITDENHDELVLNSDIPVLLNISASWCSRCRRVEPIILDIADEYRDRVLFGNVNVDTEKRLTAEYSVERLPLLALLVHGKLVAFIEGYDSRMRQQVPKKLDEAIGYAIRQRQERAARRVKEQARAAKLQESEDRTDAIHEDAGSGQ